MQCTSLNSFQVYSYSFACVPCDVTKAIFIASPVFANTRAMCGRFPTQPKPDTEEEHVEEVSSGLGELAVLFLQQLPTSYTFHRPFNCYLSTAFRFMKLFLVITALFNTEEGEIADSSEEAVQAAIDDEQKRLRTRDLTAARMARKRERDRAGRGKVYLV